MGAPTKPGRTRKWVVKGTKWGAVAVLLFGLYHLLLGRLLAYSPVVVGFSKQEHASVVVYHHGIAETGLPLDLEEVVRREEAYHGLSFRWKPEIFLCRDDGEYRRLTGSNSRAIAIHGRVFVSRRAQDDARQGTIDLRIYLTHELSHAILQQRVSILRALRMPRWLLEGTAMDCAGQVGTGIYPAKSAVCQRVAEGIYCEPADFGNALGGKKGTALSCPLEDKIVFFYSQFGCFVEFLRARHGTSRYQAFLKDVVESAELDLEQSFLRVFEVPLQQEFDRFKAQAKDHLESASRATARQAREGQG